MRGGGQEEEIEETTDRARSTQHVQHEGDQSDVEEEGRGKEQVVTEVCSRRTPQCPVIQRTRMPPNSPNPSVQTKLKLDRRGSPPRERSESRVRSVLQKV